MSKQTLEQAISDAVITETVTFASEAGITHCRQAIASKQGPNGLFRFLQKEVTLVRRSDNDLNVDITGMVTDVCIVAFGVVSAYHPHRGTYSIDSIVGYLRDRYGFSFTMVCGDVRPTLTLTQEHIKFILGEKYKAELDSMPGTFELTALPFTPNEHSVTPLVPKVTETFAFPEVGPFDMGSNVLAAKNFLREVPVEFSDGATYGTIVLTGEALVVCACVYMFMEMNNSDGVHKANILEHFKEKYSLQPEAIVEHCKFLRKRAVKLERATNGETLTHELTKQSPATEIWTFKPTNNPAEALKTVESAFNYASNVIDVNVTRFGEYVIQLSGPAIKVAALLVVMCDMQKESMSGTSELLEDIRKKYGFTSKEVISMIRKIYVSRSIPGYIRSRSPEDQLALADISLRSRSYIDRQRDDLVLRHFVQKCEGDDESKLEHLTEKHYDAFKDLFIQLRDPDVAFKEKEQLICDLWKYVTLPMLIMVMEQHFQSTDM